jgi:hypothetical protein
LKVQWLPLDFKSFCPTLSALLENPGRIQVSLMPRPRRQENSLNVPRNNTVKLPDGLRERVAKAMAAEGFTVWSEFCRVALTEKCVAVERNLRSRDPQEHLRLYGRDGGTVVGRDGRDGS